MLHSNRWHRVAVVDDLPELAEKVTQRTWTLCSGFRYRNLLFLNDAFSEDGAQEYAVVRLVDGHPPTQVESYTCSWMKPEDFVRYVERALQPGWIAPMGVELDLRAHPEGVCRACA